MTPDQITQLRTILEKTKKTLEFSLEHKSDGTTLGLEGVKEALALLPGPTCNGTGKVGTGIGKDGRDFDMRSPEILEPCPDCQTCPHGVIPGIPCRECSELYEKSLGPKPDCQKEIS